VNEVIENSVFLSQHRRVSIMTEQQPVEYMEKSVIEVEGYVVSTESGAIMVFLDQLGIERICIDPEDAHHLKITKLAEAAEYSAPRYRVEVPETLQILVENWSVFNSQLGLPKEFGAKDTALLGGRDSRKDSNDGSGTFVIISESRDCTDKPWGGQWCTPWIRTKAQVHLGRGPASRISNGVSQAAQAIAATLAATGVGAPAAPWLALAGVLVKIGYNTLKNSDGSIDLYINTVSVRAGQAKIPVSIDPVSCSIILSSL